jgi:methylmalonyl-CoA mutase
MLDFADFIVLNKAKRGAEVRDVRKQCATITRSRPPRRTCLCSQRSPAASTTRVNRLFRSLCAALAAQRIGTASWTVTDLGPTELTARRPLVPGARTRYLAEIAQAGREARARIEAQVEAARRAFGVYESLKTLHDAALPGALERYPEEALKEHGADATRLALRTTTTGCSMRWARRPWRSSRGWPARARSATEEDLRLQGARPPGHRGQLHREPVAFPDPQACRAAPEGLGRTAALHPDRRNLPGPTRIPGVYPYRRQEEDPTRMFAGEGGPERTNHRFHYRRQRSRRARLSTAFDSTTLYGEDPDTRPDVYGRTGNSGVSIATLDDMKKLYSGFDLCLPSTSVSMTINGPAPMILAMFMNTAVDQQVERYLKAEGRWEDAQRRIAELHEASGARGVPAPTYKGALPPHHDGTGLGLLGVSGDQLLDRPTYERIRAQALQAVRGTVQADILKEDQAQNTCIFSTEFALRMMGDVQEFFCANAVRNFYSSRSPAITSRRPVRTDLAAPSRLPMSRHRRVHPGTRHEDRDFAPNLSFFFSMAWMQVRGDRPGRPPHLGAHHARSLPCRSHSQMLKYHVQTSGRSLRARDLLQRHPHDAAACTRFSTASGSLRNAYDETLTTHRESVRRAVAIQLVINRGSASTRSRIPGGAPAIDYLTDMVEEAVYKEFESLSSAAACWAPWRRCISAARSRNRCTTRPRARRLAAHRRGQPSSPGAMPPGLRSAQLIARPGGKQAQVAAVRAFQATTPSVRLRPSRACSRPRPAAATYSSSSWVRQGLLTGADLARCISGRAYRRNM